VSWRVRVLASPATAAGYRLAGLAAEEVARASDAGERLVAAAAVAGVGIILVEQALLDAVPSATRRAIDRRALPIIVPIPLPNWTHAADSTDTYIVELLRRAIGYRVRLQ
jgi:vacuolar-type H+-ATPase subunit F/Vma7